MSQLSVRKREGRLSGDAVAALNADLAARFGNRFTASEAIRKAHGHTLTWLENQPPDAVVFAEVQRRRDRPGEALRQARRADDSVRRRHVARGPCQRAAWRRLARLLAHECGSIRRRRRSRLRGRAGRHPQAAQRALARQRPLLPDRSGRRRLDRRHGRDPRLGHQRRALRHDEGPRPVARRRRRRRIVPAHRHAGQEILGRLRPHPFVRRLGRHARRHRRDRAAPLRHPRGDLGRALLVSRRALGLRDDDRDHPIGPADRPHRAHRRAFGARLQFVRAPDPARAADAAGRVPRHGAKRRRAGEPLRRHRRRARRRRRSPGRPSPRSAPSFGRRATTATGRR